MASTKATLALEKWLQESDGRLHAGLTIVDHEEKGVHWAAIEDIESETTIMSVPISLSLSYVNALVDSSYPYFQSFLGTVEIEAIGYFYLMTQYVNRETSFYKPYLDTLPTPESDFSQPVWFEDAEDIAWLKGTDVWHAAQERTKIWRSYYERGIELLKRNDVDLSQYTWRLFKWAATMFCSRSFVSSSLKPSDDKYWPSFRISSNGSREMVFVDLSHRPPEDLIFPVLYPAMDASNHRHDAKVEWSFTPESFSVKILESATAGSQVFNNYGLKDNSELLLGYGFCIADNPHDRAIVALKAPPTDLQDHLRPICPQYFSSEGKWSSDQATFRLPLPTTGAGSNAAAIFAALPEPMLELLLYILRHERSRPFTPIEQAHQYLLVPESPGNHYLPHIARMLVQFLAPKLSDLPPATSEPQNAKQAHARTYVASQHKILSALIADLRTFTRGLILLPSALPLARSPQDPFCLPRPHLFPLETLHELLFPEHNTRDEASPFQRGLEASAGTTDLTQLREAGWEDDALVLLLCWRVLALSPDIEMESLGDDGRVLPEYLPRPLFHRGGTLEGRTDSIGKPAIERVRGEDDNGDDEASAAAASIIPLIESAAAVVPDSLWTDDRWTAHFLARVGGQMLRFDSFTIMCPMLSPFPRDQDQEGEVANEQSDREISAGVSERTSREEPRLCIYLHGWS